MATIPVAIAGRQVKNQTYPGNVAQASWPALATNDVGEALAYGAFADRSVQFGGTFGGATVVLEGSNDGVNYFTLTDPAGAALSKTAAALSAVSEATLWVRPRVSGGSGAAISVHLFARAQ